ncbi:putative CFEM domain-containing protein [Colletotrichum sublineola]|uniref:Putative CFEM domain-containing protein n=1 Tax=Colletotrichum sublineola TaxID=1173701 RepID=A0A066XG80_COLSU|nr:putative CFEM domain-containing protein [Colletotrichum sublineola]
MRSNWLTLLLLTLCTTASTTLAQRQFIPETSGIDLRDNPSCAVRITSNGHSDEGSLADGLSLESQNITSTACAFPLHNGAAQTQIARIVVFVLLPTLSIVLRILVKYARLAPWGPDDYTIIAAYILYALRPLYYLCLDMIKASILFTFLRIFHLPDEKIRVALWVTMAINLLSGLVFTFVALFQCRPITLAWKFWTGEETGRCINMVNVSLGHAGLNIMLDIWMLILPATQILSMNLALRKKLAVMSMFSLGLFLTIVSAIRVPALLDFSKDPLNPTGMFKYVRAITIGLKTDQVPRLVSMMPAVVWSGIELNVGIFTACIPNLRQFFVRFILGRSEKKKRLASIVSGYAGGSRSAARPQGVVEEANELNAVDEINSRSSCQKSTFDK